SGRSPSGSEHATAGANHRRHSGEGTCVIPQLYGSRVLPRPGSSAGAIAIIACAMMTSGLALPSQGASQPEQEPAEASSHIIPAGQIELARLVDLAAQELGLSVEYDAAALKGSATLRL